MKNKETYAKELAGIPFSELAMTKDGKICRCKEILCRDCAFYERKFSFCREAELDNTIELPPGDRVWYIAEDEEGQESYIIPKPTSSLTVEELKYAMGKKYFPTREEAAEARLKGIKEKVDCTRAKLDEGLPVRVGDPAWYVVKKSADSWIVPTSVTEITIYEDEIVVSLKNTPRRLVLDYNGEIIGNYHEIYLDKDSAEARLKKIKESGD